MIKERHFSKVFWFTCGLTFITVIFDFCVVFIPIANEQQLEFADTLIYILNSSTVVLCVKNIFNVKEGEKINE